MMMYKMNEFMQPRQTWGGGGISSKTKKEGDCLAGFGEKGCQALNGFGYGEGSVNDDKDRGSLCLVFEHKAKEESERPRVYNWGDEGEETRNSRRLIKGLRKWIIRSTRSLPNWNWLNMRPPSSINTRMAGASFKIHYIFFFQIQCL